MEPVESELLGSRSPADGRSGFQNENGKAGSGKLDAGREPVRARADNDRVISSLHASALCKSFTVRGKKRVGIPPRRSLLDRMRLVAAEPQNQDDQAEIETVLLSPTLMQYLRQVSTAIDPSMPFAFGGAHAVRTLLDRLEEKTRTER
jgi:hypothetical protein